MDRNSILKKLKIEKLNDMQRDTVDAVEHTDKDVVVLAPTGSGKTLAYLLPVAAMIDTECDELQAVVIVPGRELAMQSNDVLASMGTGVRSTCLYGGRATMDEHRTLSRVKPHIVFATPGRLNDHIDKLNFDAQTVRLLVIDEFDKCLRMGFRAEMQKAMERLPQVRRRILLSATDAEEMPSFVRLNRTLRIDRLPKDAQTSERIDLYTVKSPEKDKLHTLSKLLRSLGDDSTIVFMNYRDGVERVYGFLCDEGFVASCLHGGKEQDAREEAVYRFANGSVNVLVATDLASRGLDIPDVANIIHYNLPVGEDEYIHRTGRTGRWDATGRTFLLLGPEETLPEYVRHTPDEYSLEDVTTVMPLPRMTTIYIGKGKKDKISKGDILGFLCKTCMLKAADIGRIDVYERFAYVAVRRQTASLLLKNAAGKKVKGLRTVVEKAF